METNQSDGVDSAINIEELEDAWSDVSFADNKVTRFNDIIKKQLDRLRAAKFDEYGNPRKPDDKYKLTATSQITQGLCRILGTQPVTSEDMANVSGLCKQLIDQRSGLEEKLARRQDRVHVANERVEEVISELEEVLQSQNQDSEEQTTARRLLLTLKGMIGEVSLLSQTVGSAQKEITLMSEIDAMSRVADEGPADPSEFANNAQSNIVRCAQESLVALNMQASAPLAIVSRPPLVSPNLSHDIFLRTNESDSDVATQSEPDLLFDQNTTSNNRQRSRSPQKVSRYPASPSTKPKTTFKREVTSPTPAFWENVNDQTKPKQRDRDRSTSPHAHVHTRPTPKSFVNKCYDRLNKVCSRQMLREQQQTDENLVEETPSFSSVTISKRQVVQTRDQADPGAVQITSEYTKTTIDGKNSSTENVRHTARLSPQNSREHNRAVTQEILALPPPPGAASTPEKLVQTNARHYKSGLSGSSGRVEKVASNHTTRSKVVETIVPEHSGSRERSSSTHRTSSSSKFHRHVIDSPQRQVQEQRSERRDSQQSVHYADASSPGKRLPMFQRVKRLFKAFGVDDATMILVACVALFIAYVWIRPCDPVPLHDPLFELRNIFAKIFRSNPFECRNLGTVH